LNKLTIRNKIYKKFKGQAISKEKILKAYIPLRKGDTFFANTDVHNVVINPLIKEGKIKRIGRGVYEFD